MTRSALLAATALLLAAPGAHAMTGNGWTDVTTYTTDAQGSDGDNQTLNVSGNGKIVVTTPTTVNIPYPPFTTTTGIAAFTTNQGGAIILNATNGVISSSLDSAIAVESNSAFGGPNTATLDSIDVAAGNTVTTSANAPTVSLRGADQSLTTVNNSGTFSNTGSGYIFDVDDQGLQVNNRSTGTITGDGDNSVFNVGPSAATANQNALVINNAGLINDNGGDLIFDYYNIAFRYNQTAGSSTGEISFRDASNSVLDIEGGTFDGDLVLNAGHDNSVTLGGTSYTGAITLTGATQDTIQFNNGTATTTVTSTGGNGNQFAVNGAAVTGDIALTGESGSVVSIQGGSLNGNISDDATSTDNTVQIFGGEYTGTVTLSANDSDLYVSGGIANLVGANTAPSINVMDQGVLNLGNTAVALTTTFNGLNITTGQLGSGVLALGTASHTLTGDLTIDAGSTLRTTIASNTAQANGKLAVSGLITIADGATLAPTLPTGANMVTGTKDFTVLTGTGADVGAMQILNPYILYDITDVSTAGNRTIEITRLIDPTVPGTTSSTVYSQNANNEAAAEGVFKIMNGDNAVTAFQDRVNASTSQGQLDGALNELTPQADDGANQATYRTAMAAADLVDVRLGNLRNGTTGQGTGLNGGDGVDDRHAWLQGFGASTSQGRRDGVNGYGADSGGVAFGLDGQLANSKTALGVSFSYANSDVRSHDNLKRTGIDSYQANLYASQGIDTGVEGLGTWFVDALVGFAWNDFDTARHINTPAVTAKGDYDGQTYLARLGLTRSYDASGMIGRGFSLTPGASLTYAYNHFEDYREHGAGGLSLNVNQKNANLLEGKIGTGVGYTFTADRNVTVRPGVHANYLYDILDDSVGRTSTFTGSGNGGANFATAGQATARSGFNAGADLTVFSADCGMDLVATYDFETRHDYTAHSGQLRLRKQF